MTNTKRDISYAQTGVGASCNAAGHPGVCRNRSTTSCGTYYDSDDYCPGGNNVQCCVNSQVSCRSGSGTCHNDSSGGFGNTYSCSGTWYTGFCPGPNDVRCCVAAAPPPPPPPTATPTPTAVPTPTPNPNGQSDTPGVVFSGDGSTNFGNGDSSYARWLVGGITYPEVFTSASTRSTTSYQYILDKATHAGITITNLTTLSGCASLSNCTLPANLANGVYRGTGNVNLNAYTFTGNRDYVFLIQGTLTIQGSILTQLGSTALFSASQNIVVNQNVGAVANTFPVPAGQLQGFFSADRNFTVAGINNCITGPDRMLDIEGAIIVNASGAGGALSNQRDLCGGNPNFPSLTVSPRLDMVLNLPVFLMKQKTTYREDSP